VFHRAPSISLLVLCLGGLASGSAQAGPNDPTESALKQALADLAQARKEIKTLQNDIVKKQAQLLAAQAERDQLKEQGQITANQLRSLQNQTRELQAIVEKLQRQLGLLQGGQAKSPAGARNPPPGNLKGVIAKIDPTNGKLVTINLGSDDGLKINHTLEVFRLKPQPVYLGTIRVLAVAGRSAVAQLLQAPRAGQELKVGDQVGSQIAQP
jgi:hypothetical protein